MINQQFPTCTEVRGQLKFGWICHFLGKNKREKDGRRLGAPLEYILRLPFCCNCFTTFYNCFHYISKSSCQLITFYPVFKLPAIDSRKFQCFVTLFIYICSFSCLWNEKHLDNLKMIGCITPTLDCKIMLYWADYIQVTPRSFSQFLVTLYPLHIYVLIILHIWENTRR